MKSAYCGSDCRECPVYLASVGRDTAAQIRLADEYSDDTPDILNRLKQLAAEYRKAE